MNATQIHNAERAMVLLDRASSLVDEASRLMNGTPYWLRLQKMEDTLDEVRDDMDADVEQEKEAKS